MAKSNVKPTKKSDYKKKESCEDDDEEMEVEIKMPMKKKGKK